MYRYILRLIKWISLPYWQTYETFAKHCKSYDIVIPAKVEIRVFN